MRKRCFTPLSLLAVTSIAFLANPKQALAWEGEICVGFLCPDIGPHCVWAPAEAEPITMAGKIQRLALRHGSADADVYGFTFADILNVKRKADLELDWHLYFDDSRCRLYPDGSCSKAAVQTIGSRFPAGEPTPIIEFMALRHWKSHTDDYWFYANTTWRFWSADMTHALFLKPGAMGAADATGRGGHTDFNSDSTSILSKKAWAQGWVVVDQPNETEGHAHAEMHPLHSLAVLHTDYYKEQRYRISTFVDPQFHQITDCTFGAAARKVEWRLPVPPYASTPNTKVNVNLSFLNGSEISADAGSAEVRLEPDGKRVVYVKVDMPGANEFGRLWVGDVFVSTEHVPVDFKVKLKNTSGSPKSLGFFSKTGAPCAPCTTTNSTVCQQNVSKECRRRYEVSVDAEYSTAANFSANPSTVTSKWTIRPTESNSATPKSSSWNKATYAWDVGRGKFSSNYTAFARLEAAFRSGQFTGNMNVEHSISVPSPSVQFGLPFVKFKSKTDSTLTYEFTTGATPSSSMVGPFKQVWTGALSIPETIKAEGSSAFGSSNLSVEKKAHFSGLLLAHNQAVASGPSALTPSKFVESPISLPKNARIDNIAKVGNSLAILASLEGKELSGTITNHQAKAQGYALTFKHTIDDAYRAERAEGSVGIKIPQLALTGKLTHTAASVRIPASVPPLSPSLQLKVSPEWKIAVSPQMAIGHSPFNQLKVTWPVKYEWTVVSGSEFITTKVSGASNEVLDLVWKSDKIDLANCAEIRVKGFDQYGHEPILSFQTCGGLMGDELEKALEEQKKKLDEMLAAAKEVAKKLKRYPIRRPGPVINEPYPPYDPAFEYAIEFVNRLSAIKSIVSGSRGVRGLSFVRAVTRLAPVVAKLRSTNSEILRSAGINSMLYVGSPAQIAALQGVRARLPQSVFQAYHTNFANVTANTLDQITPSLRTSNPRTLNTVRPNASVTILNNQPVSGTIRQNKPTIGGQVGGIMLRR